MSVAQKPVLLPERFQELELTIEGLQNEILRPMEVISLDGNQPMVRVTLGDYANDAAAAVGGVPVNGLYRNGSALMVRVA